MTRALALGLVWVALVAAVPLPAVPPPPDLTGLIPIAEAPLDRPPIAVSVALPAVPVDLPGLPPLPILLPAADKPAAFAPAPRALPCVGAWLGIASESLGCGRARFARGELDEAVRALEQAARPGNDPDIVNEARYWLGETLWRLGRVERADWLFRQVAQDAAREEWGTWALHSSGWSALRLGDAARARDAFAALLARPVPAPLEAWGRHGLGLALYALGRFQDARQAWAALVARAVPPALARDVPVWYGDALGRVGEYAAAQEQLARFAQDGSHPLAAAGQLRLAWWALAGGRVPDAVAAFRAALAAGLSERDADWGHAGLARALLASGDWSGARASVAALAGRGSPLALPMLLRLVRAALDSPPPAEVDAVIQEVLARDLAPSVRAWVLVMQGELARARGNRDDARTQFDLARQTDPAGPIAAAAVFRLAQTNYELHEYAQAVADLTPLLAGSVAPDLRAAALVLTGEAAWAARDWIVAAGAYRRMLHEFPDRAEIPLVQLALAWTTLRQGRAEEARRALVEFARGAPDHPQAPAALELAAELAAKAGDLADARPLLDRLVTSYPVHASADWARVNRAIVLLRAGRVADALAAARTWLVRAPRPELRGRAHAVTAVALLAAGDLAQAAAEFGAARREGLPALANLGLGVVALHDGRWDDAARAFAEAKGRGAADVESAADYGLAVVAFQRGRVREFRAPALAALEAAGAAPGADDRRAALLYVLTTIALEDRDWPGALDFARRLATEFPRHAAADDALERVSAAAAGAGAWRVAHDATVLLRQQYPESPFAQEAWIRLAQAQTETGRAAQARQALERFVADSPLDPRAGQAWLALARAREVLGDRSAALEAYAAAARATRLEDWSRRTLLAYGRLLAQDRRGEEARRILRTLLARTDGADAVEPALAIAETYAAEGDQASAVEYYLTAAYLAPESPGGRRGLLAAAQALAALGQGDAAAIAYRKLLGQGDLPRELAAAARQGLAGLHR